MTVSTPAPTRSRPGFWRRFSRHRVAVLGALTLVLLTIACFGAAFVAPFPQDQQDLLLGPVPPTAQHWLGTDELGRDYLSEILYAGKLSLTLAIAVALISTAIGVFVGAVAGYRGGWIDDVFMRITDLFLIVPAIALLALALQGLGPSPVSIIIVLSLIGWTYIARVVRGQVVSLREREFIDAARVIGATHRQVLTRHILPNLSGVIAVNVALAVAGAIIVESTLSFLGFGVQPPQTSWGNMLSQASGLIGTPKVYLLYFPGLFILITVLAVNFVGDGLRDAMDPRSGTDTPSRRGRT
ncbi:MAG: ABC transporter permease subunit [Actinobacteria bacterium]|nr:ABC transporter permease subunit [Actinomycetota bacterium]